MSIKDRQLKDTAREVLEGELLAGRFPDLSTIQQKVQQQFKERALGLPRFVLKPVANKQVSSADNYNEMIHTLYKDLTTSFDEVRYQSNKMMALADYYETEKQRIQLEIRKTNRRMDILDDKLANRGKREVVADSFYDFLSVELNKNIARSLPNTDAFVDLRQGQTILDSIQSGAKKVDMANAVATVKSIGTYDSFTQLGSVDNLLKDSLNESWRHEAVKSTADGAEVTLTIELTSAEQVNLLSITPLIGRPTVVTLSTSEDGETYKQEISQTLTGFHEWNFELRNIKFVQVNMKKDAPDASDGVSYYYFFGAQEISLRRNLFVEESSLISKAHQVNRIVDKITLKVEEVIPPGTRIDYFLAEDKMDGSILEWESLNPNEQTFFNAMENVDLLIDETSAFYGEFYETSYNHDYYTLVGLEHTPYNRTTEIMVGEGMYQVDSLSFTPAQTPFTPTLDSWKGVREYDTSFLHLSSASGGKDAPVEAGKLERMTLYVTMAKDYILYANPLDKSDDMKVSVYLNNVEVRPIRQDYTYSFKKGLNKLEFIYYSPTSGTIAPNLSKTYLESIGATSIYATNQSMKELSIYDLLHNTSKTDYQRFALDENNKIVINYDPKAFDRDGVGVRYDVSYRYPIETSKASTYLRFMAKLSRDSDKGDLTPVLKGYKLLIE